MGPYDMVMDSDEVFVKPVEPQNELYTIETVCLPQCGKKNLIVFVNGIGAYDLSFVFKNN